MKANKPKEKTQRGYRCVDCGNETSENFLRCSKCESTQAAKNGNEVMAEHLGMNKPPGPLEFMIHAANERGWGTGATIAEATKECVKRTRLKPERFWILPPGSVVEAFQIHYPQGYTFTMTPL